MKRSAWKNIIANQSGSIVVEASIILPLFIGFVMILNCFIQATIIQTALQTAVSESNKQIATHMYPVKLLYAEAKEKAVNSRTGVIIQQVLDQIAQARSKVTASEDFAGLYASYIPEPIVLILEWEKKKREFYEDQGQNKAQQTIDQIFTPLLNKAFTKLVLQFADTSILQAARFNVVEVKLPDLEGNGDKLFSIEAQYDYHLPIPFFHKTISLRKRATERIWVGH
jgi:hypothetical protein